MCCDVWWGATWCVAVGLVSSRIRWSSSKPILIHQILCTTKLPIAPLRGSYLYCSRYKWRRPFQCSSNLASEGREQYISLCNRKQSRDCSLLHKFEIIGRIPTSRLIGKHLWSIISACLVNVFCPRPKQ